MKIYAYGYPLIRYVVIALILYVIVMILLRWIVNYADMNPFGGFARTVRHYSDQLVGPVRSHLFRVRFSPKFAPLITILIAILGAYFLLQFCGAILFTLDGVIISLRRGAIVVLIGYLLYGLLTIFSLMIIARIVLSWLMIGGNRFTSLLYRATEPVLAPFRRLIPPVAMFDLSPIIVLLLIGLFREAVAGTLIASSGIVLQ
jgi:YggT family protein